MKKIFYIKTAFVALLTVAGLSSCLKDDSHYVDFAGATPLIELPSAANVGGAGGLVQSLAFEISTTPIPVNLAVNLAAPKTLGSDVTVKLGVDAAALTAYNTANSKSYELLPAADYTSDFSVVIKAGTNLTNLVINIKSNLIDVSKSYALPVSITDGGGQQISNYKTVIYTINVKNKYDGSYASSGHFEHPVATSSRDFAKNKNLATINGNTVQTTIADLANTFQLTVNADNSVTINGSVNAAGDVIPQPGKTNTYDPATKTFTLHYQYAGGGGNRVIDEVIKKN